MNLWWYRCLEMATQCIPCLGGLSKGPATGACVTGALADQSVANGTMFEPVLL